MIADADQSRLEALLLRWEQLRHDGHDATVEELCPGSPDLASELGRRIAAQRRLYELRYEVDQGDVLSRQQIGDAYLLINPGQRNDVPVGRHDRDVGITKSSGPIRVGARVAINLELAIDEVDDPIISDARPGITVCFDAAVVR